MTKPLPLELDRSAKTPLAEQIRKGISGRHRERRARAGRAPAVLAGPRRPARRRPRYGALGVRKAVRRSTHRRFARDRNPCRGSAFRHRSTGRSARSRLVHGDVSGADHRAGDFPDGRARAGDLPRQAASPGFAHTPFARNRARRRYIRTLAANWNCGGKSPRYLAIARGIECSPSQIIITGGFSSGLGLALRVLGLEGRKAWVEDPGFPFTRHGLELARLSLAPIPVDADGIDVDYGLHHAPDAAMVVVTPGQQAPLGSTLSLARRLRLLDWAAQEGVVGDRGRLSERAAAERPGRASACLTRSRRARHSHRLLQQDPDARLAPGLSRCPLPLASRFAEVAASSRAGARAIGAARDRGVHARRPLYAASPAHQARLCGASATHC